MNTLASNPFQAATIIRVNNPFDVADQTRELAPLSEDVRLGDLITLDDQHAVSVNGELLEDAWEDRAIIGGDYVVICPVPAGGGGSKNILRVVALIAVAVAAGPLAGAILGQGASAFAVGALQAGITIAGSMIVNALIPIEQSIPQSKALEESSPSYGLDGAKNTEAEGIPVPVVYGTYRVGGNLVNLHIENLSSEGTQDLYMLYAQSEGPIAGINPQTIKLNDQPIDNFNDVDWEIRNGTDNQELIPWFEDNIIPYNVGVTLSQAWNTYTTQGSVDKLRVDLLCPQGLREINDSGESLALQREVYIEYRQVGETEWTRAKSGERTITGTIDMAYITVNGVEQVMEVANLPANFTALPNGTVTMDETYDRQSSYGGAEGGSYFPPDYDDSKDGKDGNGWEVYYSDSKGSTPTFTRTVTVGTWSTNEFFSYATILYGKKASPYRRSYAWAVPYGQYEIRVRRPTEESTDGQIIDKIQWTDLNEITLSDVRYKHTALLGLKIRLTDQLNSRPKVTAEVSGRLVRVPQDWYQVGNPWVLRHSANPAWVALDAMTNARFGPGYGDNRIDFYSWMRWAAYCDENNLEFNGIFDTDMNFWDALTHVFRAGRAKIVPQGIKYGVAVEKAEFPAMMFNVSNMLKSTLTINWLSMSERANEIEATFYDRNNDFKATALKVVSPTLQQGATPRVVSMNLIGVTDAEQARKEAQLLLNMNRFIQQTISFEAPVESLACKVGSMVLVQHDIPQWGYGGRTAAGSTDTEIKLDRPVTMDAGESYTLILNYDSLPVVAGTLGEKINPYNFYIDTDYGREGHHVLITGGQEYAVQAVYLAGDGVRRILTLDEPCPALQGDDFELHRLDALEERNVVLEAGETDTLTLTSPMPAAPGRYVKWLFGKLEGSQKQFRVLAIEGEGLDTRKLTCIEYYDAIYGTDDAIAEPPNYSDLPVAEHVTNLSATQLRKNVGTISYPVILLEWEATQQYSGAKIYVRRQGGNWQWAGDVEREESSFEYDDLILGEILTFMVLAKDGLSAVAPRATAPQVSIEVTAAGDVLEPPSNISCKYDGSGIRLDFDNPDVPTYLETEIFHATVDDVTEALRIHRGAQEFFVHEYPNDGNNFYWLRTINTDKVPGVYSNSVIPDPLTQVQNLRLKSAFVGKTAQIIWDTVPGAAAYQVEVRTKSTLRRSERVSVNEYRYSIEDALEDGDVDRNIEFTVWAVGSDGQTGPTKTLAVTNPPPALPTDLSVAPGFKMVNVEFTPPTDPDYVDTVIWVGTTSGFTPAESNRVAAIPGGPISIGNLDDNTDYYIRMSCRDAWGMGVTSAEYNARTLDLSAAEGLSPWAYVTDADRQFIEDNLTNDAIPSEKIVSITASRITTGTLAATEKISVEGQIESVVGPMVVTVGPKLIGAKVALFSIMNGASTLVRFNEDGTSEYNGPIYITGGSGYANLSDKPTSLADISGVDAQALADATQNAQDALDAAQGSITTFWQSTAPLANAEGDLWFDTDGGNKVYRWNGSNWQIAQDSQIADAIDAASNAQATADGKVKTFFQTSTPTATGVGDLWYSSSTKLLKRWSGSSWVSVANAISNTSELTDDAGLGEKAQWDQITGANKPADNATYGANWATTLSGIPARLGDTAATGLNLTVDYMGYFDGTDWGSYIDKNGNVFLGDYAQGQYLDFNAGTGVLQLGPKTSIGVNEDRLVTVGSGGDFSSLSAALEALSRTVPAYKNGGFQAEVRLLSGFSLTETIHVKHVDLSWITITSVDANVSVSYGSITHDYPNDYSSFNTFIFKFTDGAKSPIIDTVFSLQGQSGNYCGIVVHGAGSAVTLKDGGFRYGDINLYVANGGTANALGVAILHNAAYFGIDMFNTGILLGQEFQVNNAGSYGIRAANSKMTVQNLSANYTGGSPFKLTNCDVNCYNLYSYGASAVAEFDECTLNAQTIDLDETGFNMSRCRVITDALYGQSTRRSTISGGSVDAGLLYVNGSGITVTRHAVVTAGTVRTRVGASNASTDCTIEKGAQVWYYTWSSGGTNKVYNDDSAPERGMWIHMNTP